MRILIAIPHAFRPRTDSLLSSETASKREQKQIALRETLLGNLDRFRDRCVVHRYTHGRWISQTTPCEGDRARLMVHHCPTWSLLPAALEGVALPPELSVVTHNLADPSQLPMRVTRHCLETAMADPDIDLVVYLEDDLAVLDRDLPAKVQHLVQTFGEDYLFMPHRCETRPGLGDVVLAGEPLNDGTQRPWATWATGEQLQLDWLGRTHTFVRGVNPHAGCFWMTRQQAVRAHSYWTERRWTPDYTWVGPLEMACTGLFLPIFRMMKIVPEQARFFHLHHCDALWEGIPEA